MIATPGRRVAAVLLCLAIVGCDGGSGAQPPDVGGPEEVIAATAAVTGLAFTTVLEASGVQVGRAEGVLDVTGRRGHRVATLTDPSGEEESAQVQSWFVDGQHLQRRADGEELEPVAGDLGGFLGLAAAPDATTLRAALEALLAGRSWEPVGSAQLEGESMVQVTAQPGHEDQRPVTLLVDADGVLRQIREPGVGPGESVSILTLTPTDVTVPPLPEGS